MPARIALQLHSVRDEAAKDLPATLERVAQIGYPGVETAALSGVGPDELRRHLDDAGLKPIAGFGPFGTEWPEFLDHQETLGNEVIVTSLMPDSFASRGSIERAAEALNGNADEARRRGITVLYHNHTWELRTRKEDGVVPFWSFLDLLDPAIGLEPDIYWIYGAGLDPAETLARLGPRVRRLHVKDGPGTAPAWPDGPADFDPHMAIGTGVLDIPGALAAVPQAEWHVVEFDACATDIFEALEESYRYLTEADLSAGR